VCALSDCRSDTTLPVVTTSRQPKELAAFLCSLQQRGSDMCIPAAGPKSPAVILRTLLVESSSPAASRTQRSHNKLMRSVVTTAAEERSSPTTPSGSGRGGGRRGTARYMRPHRHTCQLTRQPCLRSTHRGTCAGRGSRRGADAVGGGGSSGAGARRVSLSLAESVPCS
jgi:hypothetical protein